MAPKINTGITYIGISAKPIQYFPNISAANYRLRPPSASEGAPLDAPSEVTFYDSVSCWFHEFPVFLGCIAYSSPRNPGKENTLTKYYVVCIGQNIISGDGQHYKRPFFLVLHVLHTVPYPRCSYFFFYYFWFINWCHWGWQHSVLTMIFFRAVKVTY